MIRQLKVKLEDRPGALAEVVGLLAQAGVDLKALEVDEGGEAGSGQMHTIVSDLERARRALDGAGRAYAVEPVLVVEMDDQVGGLAAILRVLAEARINVRYLYAFVTRVRGKSLAVLTVDRDGEARGLLQARGFHLVSEQGLHEATHPAPDLNEHFGADFIW